MKDGIVKATIIILIAIINTLDSWVVKLAKSIGL